MADHGCEGGTHILEHLKELSVLTALYKETVDNEEETIDLNLAILGLVFQGEEGVVTEVDKELLDQLYT
jgi:hypothetical protein